MMKLFIFLLGIGILMPAGEGIAGRLDVSSCPERDVMAPIGRVGFTAGTDQELVQNGDFESELDYWTEEVNNNQGSHSITRSTSYRPGPDYSVRVYKYMRYFARLYQVVDIPSTDVRFSGQARLIASKGTANGYYAYAALILDYRNSAGGSLGRTMILKKVGSYFPENTPTQHIVNVTSNEWEDYSFSIADELDNLTGVDPNEVAAISVILESYGTGATG